MAHEVYTPTIEDFDEQDVKKWHFILPSHTPKFLKLCARGTKVECIFTQGRPIEAALEHLGSGLLRGEVTSASL